MKKVVLLIEDNSDDVFFMERSLKKIACECLLQVVEDGQQALHYFSGEDKFSDRKQFPLPDLVLLDLKLPHLSGLEVLQWIRQKSALQFLPVLMLTSSREQRDIQRAYEIGADSYLVKPASAEELLDLVRAICDFWLKYHEPAPKPTSK